jgi:hypothetical protein
MVFRLGPLELLRIIRSITIRSVYKSLTSSVTMSEFDKDERSNESEEGVPFIRGSTLTRRKSRELWKCILPFIFHVIIATVWIASWKLLSSAQQNPLLWPREFRKCKDQL